MKKIKNKNITEFEPHYSIIPQNARDFGTQPEINSVAENCKHAR